MWVIFRLPDNLRCFYPHPLAYIELFTPFNCKPDSSHSLHTCSPALHNNGHCSTAVIPISDIVLACHLAPDFSYTPKDVCLDHFIDLLAVGQRFFLNHYSSYFFFLLIRHWCRIAARRSARLNAPTVR
jgi:hypothetical protein